MSPSADHVNVVVTCTQAKRVDPAVHAATGALDLSLPVEARVQQWAEALVASEVPAVTARDLYSGDHWSVARSLHDPSGQRAARVWVASAGYGLVGIDAPLIPYAATFRTGECDSVSATADEAPAWWGGLTRVVPSPEEQAPRSIHDLVCQDPDAALVVVASTSYLHAMAEDLGQAYRAIREPEAVMVVTSSAEHRGSPLPQAALRFDARIRAVVGGAMQGLNVRVARLVLERSAGRPLRRPMAQAILDEAASGLAKFQYPRRTGQGDDAVRAFIARELKADPKATKSRLLRELRAQGRACEQKRFGALFDAVKAVSHA